MENKIIDIHTHILYGMDDGASNREMSMKLMGMEYEQGVRGIFLTNHSGGYLKHGINNYERRFETLKRLAHDVYPDLRLYNGSEILCFKDWMPDVIRNIRRGVFPTMNHTEYVLIEFAPNECKGMLEMTYCIKSILDAGYKPIIAHIERYKKIYNDPYEDIEMLREMGCLTQINLYSFAQDKGDRHELANMYMEHFMFDFVGTDTHRTDYKAAEAKVGALYLEGKLGGHAKFHLGNNASHLLIGG